MSKWINNCTNADGTPYVSTFTTVRARIDSDDIDLNYGAFTEYEIDGRTYQVKLDNDECYSIMDEQGEGMWCGRLEWTSSNDYGKVRPSDFNGNAEVLLTDRNSSLWWQPEPDCKPNSDIRASVKRQIEANLECGYYVIDVTDEDGNERSVCGLDAPVWPDHGEYHRDTAADFIAELHADFIDASWAMPDLQRWMRSGR